MTSTAREHLEGIRHYLTYELKSPVIARKFLTLLRESMERLAIMPASYRVIDEEPWGSQGVRKILVKKYYMKKINEFLSLQSSTLKGVKSSSCEKSYKDNIKPGNLPTLVGLFFLVFSYNSNSVSSYNLCKSWVNSITAGRWSPS